MGGAKRTASHTMNAVLSHWGRALNSLDVRRRNDTILRNKNVAIFILAAIGIILMIWDEEMKWSSGPQYRYGLHNNQVDVPFTVFDVLIPATNALLVWRLVDVYYFMSHLCKSRTVFLQPRTGC